MSEPQHISQTRQLLYAGAAAGLVFLLGERLWAVVFAGLGVYAFTAIEGWFADLNRSLRDLNSSKLGSN